MARFLAGFFIVFLILLVIVTLFGCDNGLKDDDKKIIKTVITE